MSTLEQAIAIAAAAHAGQTDKCGEPYILHPLRVMLAMSTTEERVVAILHDTIEDTDLTFERLAQSDFQSSIEALDRVTRRTHETYAGFIEGCAEDPLARRVKIADLRDNLSPARFNHLPLAEQQSKRKRYHAALQTLGAAERPGVTLPETHVNGAPSSLTHAVACILSEARPMSYQNAMQAALKVIPLVREADRAAGVRP